MRPAWIKKDPSMSLLYRFVVGVVWCWFKLLYRHRVYGNEHFYDQAAIIAANHASYYDPPILAISWPQQVHFLAREGLFNNPLFGGFIRNVNSHPVRGNVTDIGVFKVICKLLAEGKKLILFPEGKRGDRDEQGALKSGIAVLVARSQSAVIPTYIHGTFTIWNRFCRFPKLWGKTACVFGTPILWAEFAHLEKKEAQQALMAPLERSLQALRTWYLKGAHGSPP